MKQNYFLIFCALFVFGLSGKATAQVKIIETIAGTGTAGYNGDGIGATAAQINLNYFMALDVAGNLYFADYGNNRVREIYTNGIIATIAGVTGPGGYSADNVPASTSKLNSPEGIALDAAGNIYIGDYLNNRIRKITASTGVITTIAGTGTAGYSGDGSAATAAKIDDPHGVAVDASGNVYFSDGGTTTTRVRMITASTGIISTVAGDGTAGYVADYVPATSTEINNPRGIAVNSAGDIFIADMGNNRIRTVLPAYLYYILTSAGNGTGAWAGDGTPATSAEISGPTDIKFDAAGNGYIADAGNERIRLVNGTTSDISTIAGTGAMGATGDGGPATAATFYEPVAIAIAPNGNYYIADRSNNLIRVVRNDSQPYFVGPSKQYLTVCENSSGNSINALLPIIDSDQYQTETYTMVSGPHHGVYALSTVASNAGEVTPTGCTYTPNIGYSGLDTFTVSVSDGYLSSTILDTVYVTVNPLPTVAAITGANSVCISGNTTLNDVTGSGVWSASNTNVTIGAGTGYVTGVASGTVIISYTVTNACGPTSSLYTFSVNPNPVAGSISGLSSVCATAAITLTDVGSSGGTGAWSSSTSAASVGAGTGVVTGVSAGTTLISYMVSSTCGNAVATQPVTVMAIPSPGAITGSSSVCVGASTPLSDATGAGGGTWSAGNTDANVTSGLVEGVSAGTDIISYTVSNVCGNASATSNIIINPLATAGTITGPTGVCLAGTITLIDATGSGTGTWSSPDATVTVASGTGVITGVSGGTAIITYSATNICSTAVTTYPITIITVPSAGTITGPVTVCQGANITLGDVVTGGIWSTTNATATIGSSSGTITGVSGGTNIITYFVNYTCGSAFTTYSITVNPLPSPAAITGPTNVCMGASTSLGDATTGGIWSATNSHASISLGGLVSGSSAGIDTIKYSITNGCGTVSTTLAMTVSPNVTPSDTISANPGFTSCPGALVTYTATPVNGGSAPLYTWTVNGSVVASSGSFVYAPSNGDTIIAQMASSAACATLASVSDTVIVTVTPTEAPSVSISTGIYGTVECIGTVVPFTATPADAGIVPTYQWLVNGINTGTGNPFNYTPNNGDMVSAVVTSSFSCPLPATATSNTVTMTVNTTEIPSVSIIATPGNDICAGTEVTFTAIPIYGGIAPSFTWTKDGINVATGPIYIYTPASGDNVYCTLVSSATCSTLPEIASNIIDLTANAVVTPAVSITVSTTDINVGQVTTFTAHVTGTSSPTYQWYVNGILISGATLSTYTLNGVYAGTENVTCVAGAGSCSSQVESNSIAVIVSGLGVAQVTQSANFTLLPNPNNGSFTLQGTLTAANGQATIEVTDILGRMVYHVITQVQNGAVKQQISLGSGCANGIYLLHLVSGDENAVMRFTVSQ